MIDEVMVVAYGTAKKSSFPGSASTVKADKLAKRSVSNVTNALPARYPEYKPLPTMDNRVALLLSAFAVSAP